MPQVFDRQTAQPVQVSPEEAQAGLVSGKYALDTNAGPVAIKNAQGEIFTGPAHKAVSALAKGGYSLLSPEEEIQHRVKQEEEAKGIPGSLAAAGSSFVNQALLGIPGAIAEHTETPEEKIATEAREKFHAPARFLGGLGGVAASTIAGGEFFKGAQLAGEAAGHLVAPGAVLADAGLGARLAAKTADLAAQGAIISAPQALVHAAFGDPKQAAETMLWGFGTGAVLGGGAELLGTGARAAGSKLSELLSGSREGAGLTGAADKFANNTAIQAAGLQKTQTRNYSKQQLEDMGNFLHESGAIQPGMSRAQVGQKIEELHKTVGKGLGDAISALDSAAEKTGFRSLPDGTRTPAPMTDFMIKPGDLADRLRADLEVDPRWANMSYNDAKKRAAEGIIADAMNIPTTEINGQKVVTWKDANDWLSDIRAKDNRPISKVQSGGGVKGLEAITEVDKTKALAYESAKNYVHEAADTFAVAADRPELVNALAKAKKEYAILSQLRKGTANLEAQEAGNKLVSLTDELRTGEGFIGKGTSAVGAGVGGFLGGFPGAVVGERLGKLAGVPLDFMAKKWQEDKGLVLMSALAKRAAKEGPEVFSAVIGAEGQKRLAATLEGVQDTIRRMAQVGFVDAETSREHMTHLLGGPGSTSGLSHDQQYDKLASRLNELATNPVAMAQATSALASPFHSTAPDVAEAYQAKMAQAINYLHAALPKPPAPPAPFAPNNWAPSPQQKLEFHDKAEILANPMAAMRHLAQGTLSDAHLDSLQQNYPALYSKMQNSVLAFHANHPDVKLPSAERASVGKFLGAALEPLAQPQRIAALQATYQTGAGGGAGGGAAKPSGVAKPAGSSSSQRPVHGKLKKLPSSESAFASTQGAHLGGT